MIKLEHVERMIEREKRGGMCMEMDVGRLVR